MREAAPDGSNDPQPALALAQASEEADDRPERRGVEEGHSGQVDDHVRRAHLLDEAVEILAKGGRGEGVDLAMEHDEMRLSNLLDRRH